MTLNPATLQAVKAHLEREEGRVAHAYADHLGYLTIGVGRLIDRRKGGRLRDSEIDLLLANDVADVVAQLEADPRLTPAWGAVKNDPYRATALISMCFQMGAVGLASFRNSLALVAAHRFAEAAASMRKSKWARQTPERAARVTRMMETGGAA